MENKKLIGLSALSFIVLVPAYFAVRQFDSHIPRPKSYRNHEIIKSFELPEITSSGLTGGYLENSDLQGRVVLLHFWATWCASCRDELPVLEEYAETLRDKGVEIFGILSSDNERDALRSKLLDGRPFRNVVDESGEVAAKFKVRSLPMTFLISSTGEILYRTEGLLTERDKLEMNQRLTGSHLAKY